MKRLAILIVVFGLSACGEFGPEVGPEHEIDSLGGGETVSQGLTKTAGGTNGDLDYCNDPANPCLAGEGDCDSDAQCEGALVCAQDNGSNFGFPSAYDFCVPTHCLDGIQSGDETSTDCGGSCGSCPSSGVNGDPNFCTTAEKCAAGEGDCDSDEECEAGLVCGTNNGADYGFEIGIDVCEAGPSCSDGVQNGDETGVDCGGSCPTSCATCSDGIQNGDETGVDCGGSCPNACSPPGSNGGSNYCDDPNFPCGIGEGDCDLDSQCQTGLICGVDNGENWGNLAGYDYCVPPHCENGVLDSADGETGVDCGGDCGTCVRSGSNGDFNYCNDPNFPCGIGEGDCDGDAECQTGLVCLPKAGLKYGIDARVDVCGIAHCKDGIQSGDETGVDCGGSCGTCAATILGSNEFDALRAVVLDGQNNQYVTGQHGGALDFGEGLVTPVGDRDLFVSKYDQAGAHIWTLNFGGVGFDDGLRLDLAPNGNLLVGGRFAESISIGGTNLTATDGIDVFLAEITPSGSVNWAKSFGGTGNEFFAGLRATSAGIYVSGGFTNTINLGGGVRTTSGFQDVFVAKFDANGNHQWDETFGGPSADYIGEVETDGNGDVWTTGAFFGTVSYGGIDLTAVGSADAFLVRLSDTGTVEFATQIGSAGVDVGRSLKRFNDGGLIFAGAFSGTTTFSGLSLVSRGLKDGFLMRIDTSGNALWVNTMGGPNNDESLVATVSPRGDIMVGGIFEGSIIIGTKNYVGASGTDGFTSKFIPDGRWRAGTRIYATSGDDFVIDMDYGTDARLVTTGYFRGSGKLANTSATAVGLSDGFFSRTYD